MNNVEQAQIHFIYGLADGNAAQARRIYQERFPNRPLPSERTFIRLHARLCETGSLNAHAERIGRPRTIMTPQLEEAILQEVEANPSSSTRRLSEQFNISHQSVWRVLHTNLLYPYHIQRVQPLLPRDFPARLDYCRWFLQKTAQNPNFTSKILFTDEATFSRDAIINFHNNHFWNYENPHVIGERGFQQQFSVNVWAGVIGDHVIGPHFLPPRLNGETYRQFLAETLPGLLEDVLLATRNDMWFMHDGAPAHFSLAARQHLNDTFAQRWIGRGGPQPWPARSPDLNPLDYFFWGHLKSLVYATPVVDENDLRNRIVNSCNVIRNTPGILERVRQSMSRRLHACIDSGGSHFEHLI
jgi:Transposase.